MAVAVQLVLSKGELDIELNTYSATMYVVQTNNVTGERTRLENFAFTWTVR